MFGTLPVSTEDPLVYAPLRGGQVVLGQGAAGRMAGLPAGVAVEDLALFAHDGGVVCRLVLAQLALEGQILRLAILVDDALHHTVLGEVVGAVFVKVYLGKQSNNK